MGESGSDLEIRLLWPPEVRVGASVLDVAGRRRRERTAAAFNVEAFASLASIKADVDPGNVLDYGLTVEPAR